MPLTLLLSVLFQAGLAPITVQVRTVDQDALALPGIEVTAIEVSECPSRTPTSTLVVKGTSGTTGSVSLALPRAHAYVVRTAAGNGFEVGEACVPNLAGTEPHYIQLQLRVDASNTFTHYEPSVGPSQPRGPLPSVAFAGTYHDPAKRNYVVDAANKGEGIYVETPELTTLAFPRRTGLTFSGDAGTVRFVAKGGRIVGMTFTPARVVAVRLD